MTNILKKKFFISFLASAIVSLASLSLAHAAEITIVTNNVDGNTISATSALLDGTVDVSEHPAEVWFEYGTSNFLGQSTPKNIEGLNFSSKNFKIVVNGLTANTTYYFQAVGRNIDTNLEVRGQILTFSTNNIITQNNSSNSNNTNNGSYTSSSAPEVTTNPAILDSIDANSAILDSYIKSNGSNTVAWFEYGTSDSLGQQTEDWGVSITAYQVDFQKKITGLMPDTIYYFRAAARNDYGTTYGNTYVFKTTETANGLTFSQPTVLTSPAMLIKDNSALLNGSAVANNAQTSVWFEWSEDPNMNIGVNRNPSQSIGAGSTEVYAAYSLVNLTVNKTYYFRLIAQNSYGTTKGNINKFTTITYVAPIPVIKTTTTPNGKIITTQTAINSDAISLSAEFDNNNPRAGTKTVYAISYTNNTNYVIRDAILKITLPNEVNYMASSFANVNQEGNIITLKVGDIAAKASGSASIKVKITDLARAQVITFNTNLTYKVNTKPGQENISNELKVSEYSLAASVLDLLGSLLNNLFIDLILGIVIGAGTYHYFITKQKEETADSDDPLK